MRPVLKRGVIGVAGVAAAGAMVVAVAAPAQASTIDAHIGAPVNGYLLRLCLTINPSSPLCIQI